MRKPYIAVSMLLAALGIAASITPARADAIDGEWCAGDGRHLTIRGPAITTPGSNQIEGDYGRHSFAYVVPENEPGAGESVVMRMLNESSIELKSRKNGPLEIWVRCKPAIS